MSDTQSMTVVDAIADRIAEATVANDPAKLDALDDAISAMLIEADKLDLDSTMRWTIAQLCAYRHMALRAMRVINDRRDAEVTK